MMGEITEEQLQKVREPIPFTPTKRLERDDVLYVTEQDIPHPIYGYAKYHKEYSVIDLRGYRKGYEPRLEISGIYTPNPEDIFRLQTGKLPPYQPTTTGDKLLAEMRRLGVHKAFRIGKPEEVPAVPEARLVVERADPMLTSVKDTTTGERYYYDAGWKISGTRDAAPQELIASLDKAVKDFREAKLKPPAVSVAVEREAKIKYFRQQEVKWREAAYKIAEEERGEALFAEAIRKADEFGRQASELEALGLPAMSVVEYDRWYTLEELREMAKQAGLSASGSKKEIAAKLIAKGVT